MPKVTLVHTNFTAGEITPKMWGRVDVARYNNGAEIIENAWPVVHGGIDKRWGTLFHSEVKDSAKATYLIPFVFSRTQAYMLEFGDLYMRVHTDAGVVLSGPSTPYEIVTPYTSAMLATMDYTQAADTILLWQVGAHPRRIRRFADDNWLLDNAPFNPPPFDEIGTRPAATLSLSASSVGSGRTFTAGAASFLLADVGRSIWAGPSGVASIVGYTDTTHVTADITVAFDATAYAANEWRITGTPQTTCTPSVSGPAGGGVTLTLSAPGWRPEDVSKHVNINQGLCRITQYTDSTHVNGEILTEMNTTVGAVANSWVLNGAVWNEVDGYPATGTFHMQRLLAAGSPSYPQTVWGSGIGEYYGFQLGVNDDDAFSFSLVSDDISPIAYLSSMEAIVAMTYGGEFTMEGGVEKPITPTNIRAKPRSNNGCEQVRPVRVGGEELFVERSGKAVRAISFDQDSGKWAVPDVSVLAEHIAQPGITDLTWHKKPNTLVFAQRTDGVLASCTFDRDQDVAGWARQNLGGVVESSATIPTSGGDRTWLIVRREIDGATVRYIEKFDESAYVDSGINGTHPTGAKVWSGLDHLEGEEVVILADGIPQPPNTVAGGQVTLARNAKAVQIGKRISMRIKLLTPEVAGSGGAAQGSAMRSAELSVRVRDTVGLSVNGQTIAFRQLGENILDQAVAPFTGLKRIENLGWERGESPVEITHDDPLPCHILSVIRKFTFNEG